MRLFSLIALTCLLAGCGEKKSQLTFPEPEKLPAVQIHLSNDKPKVGEPMDLTLRVTGDKRLVLPPVKDLLDPALEVINSETKDIENKTHWVQEQHLHLALFEVTNLSLFATSKVSTIADTPQDLILPFQSIEVQSVLPEKDAAPIFGNDSLPDFRGPAALKRRQRNIIISTVLGLVLLLGGALALWLISKRPKPPAPVIPPHRIAFQEMETLSASEIWQRPDVDASAVALSLILRHYIEARFDIRAPEQTTEEFLEMVEVRAPWSEQDQVGLKQFFTATDQIKYAASRPGSQVLEHLLEAARAFVESTSLSQTGGMP